MSEKKELDLNDLATLLKLLRNQSPKLEYKLMYEPKLAKIYIRLPKTSTEKEKLELAAKIITAFHTTICRVMYSHAKRPITMLNAKFSEELPRIDVKIYTKS